jgi:hypothetical protein
MDAEFINAYIAKQKALIDDFQTRVLLLEVRNSILEQQLAALRGETVKTESKKSFKGSNE